MSAWKLVEAVPDVVEEAPVIQQSKEHGSRDNQSEQRPRNNRPRRNPQHHGRSKQERSYYAFLATQQIDAIFHPDSLCMDTYIRSYMDEEGYVPIALVCTYQNVAYFGCTYDDIVNKLIQVEGKAIYYELDHANDTIRPKSGWEKFRMPNPFGGFGLPKYVKQPYVEAAFYNYAAAAGAAESPDSTGANAESNVDATTPATTAEVVTPSGGN